MVAFVDGERAAGRKAFKEAAAANAPADIRTFAASLKGMAVPAAEPHRARLIEAAIILEGEVTSEPVAGAAAAAQGVAGTPTSRRGEASPSDAKAERRRTVSTIVVGHPRATRCNPPSLSGSTCVRILTGPLEVSYLHVGASCPADVFVVAGPMDAPSWFVVAGPREGFSNHNGHLVVGADDDLVVGVHPVPKATPPTPPPAPPPGPPAKGAAGTVPKAPPKSPQPPDEVEILKPAACAVTVTAAKP